MNRLISLAAAPARACLPRDTWEVLWRLRSMPAAQAARMVARIRPAELLTATRMYYRDPALPAGRFTLNVRGLPHPVVLRTKTSDMQVFGQVFLERQYSGLPIRDPRVIIDAGANIGLASLFFLRKYPKARVIAVEPDPENLEVAEANLYPYRHRCTLVPGALWSSRTRLAIKRVWTHWATQVEVGPDGTNDVEAYPLDDLKTMFDLPEIDLLKIDIEGAETEVFGTGGPAVLDGVRCCAVELHGEACRKAFFSAAGNPFRFYEQGELTIAWRAALGTDRKPHAVHG
jgi:FkbM family methyltransferase